MFLGKSDYIKILLRNSLSAKIPTTQLPTLNKEIDKNKNNNNNNNNNKDIEYYAKATVPNVDSKNLGANSPSYVFGAIEWLFQLRPKFERNFENMSLFVGVVGHSKTSWHNPGYLGLVVQPLENEQRAWWI